MHKLFIKLSGCFLGAVLLVGQLTATAPCALEFYQPKVPAELKR